MKYLSVCSGIEAATVAWHHMGWNPVGFSEIEPFPSAVLAHHYPDVPNFGDMTKFKNWTINESDVDILVGGTPCQSFSVAGLRKGLSDDRGNLALVYCEIADHFNTDFVIWENVPGVLSSSGGGDFGCFLAGLAGEDEPLVPPGGKWTDAGYVLGPKRAIAWRVLDAQYFGVAQRRRRVFVVGCPRNGVDPRTILFESEGVRRDTPPSREKREGTASASGRGVAFDKQRLGEYGSGRVASTVAARDYKDATDLVIHANNVSSGPPYSRTGNQRVECDALVAVHQNASGEIRQSNVCYTLNTNSNASGRNPPLVMQSAVRRLTPVEAERLQGFPDGHTDIVWKGKATPDSHRYKALGNSMAVPVMRWIGERINRIKSI